MALVLADLTSSLTDLFAGRPTRISSAQDAADRWAAAYKAYAAGATSCLAGAPNGASLTAAEATLSAALVAAFSSKDPVTTVSAFGAAFTAFWMAPPMVFTGALPGVVTAATGAAALQAGLPGVWATIQAMGMSCDAAAAASQHATLLDTFTRLVIVLHAPPPPGPGCIGPIM